MGYNSLIFLVHLLLICFLQLIVSSSVTPGEVGCTLPEHPAGGKFKILKTTSYTPGAVVPPFSTLIGECDKGYVQIKATVYYCTDKYKWNDEIPTKVCVEYNSESVHASISNVTDCGKKSIIARTGEGIYSWVIGVYKKSEYICGGSLISAHFVLSAAHCFTHNDDGKLLDKHQYTILAGTSHRDQDHPENRHKQTSKVKSVRLHGFTAMIQNYANDIALVELETPVKFSDYVLPVCLDWENKYLTEDLREDNMGIVVSFGSALRSGSDILKKTVIPYHTRDVCLRHLPDDFGLRYLTSDKFCAGFTDNRNGLCPGDGGSGLYFQSPNDIFYIRGIASLAPRSVNSNCFPITLFTSVSHNLHWIKGAP